MSRNPYHENQKPPRLRPSVLVFLDLLGYQEMIEEAHESGTQQEFLTDLYEALTAGRNWLEDKYIPEELNALPKKDRYALKAFTDNIVIGWPIIDDAELELGSAFSKVAEFQFSMAIRGYFVRGAIAIGQA